MSAALRESPRLFCLGPSVLWRPARHSWFARHWPAVRVQAPCLRSTCRASARLTRRLSRVQVFSAGLVCERPRVQSVFFGASGLFVSLAQERQAAAQALQPPASLVAVALVCLQASSPNAQCTQALCRLARCLTIQSTGHAPAGRVMPVISNVRPHQDAPLTPTPR